MSTDSQTLPNLPEEWRSRPRWVAGAGVDGLLGLWGTAGNVAPRIIERPYKHFNSVSWSPDGRRIACGSQHGVVCVLTSDKLQEIRVLDGHADSVRSVSYSPDSRRIVSGADDNTVRVWDAETGIEICMMNTHNQRVNSVAFSPDGTRIVSGSSDNTVRVWDAETGIEVCMIDGHSGSVKSVVFSPDGARIISCSDDGTIRIWDTETGVDVSILDGQEGKVSSISASDDGLTIVSYCGVRTIHVWDTVARVVRHRMQKSDHYMCEEHIQCLACSPDGRMIACGVNRWTHRGSYDGFVEVCDASARPLSSFEVGPAIKCIAFSPEGTRIVLSTEDGDVIIRSTEGDTDKPVLRRNFSDSGVESLSVSPNGNRVVIGESYGTICVRNVNSGAELDVLIGHKGRVVSVSYSPDSRRIVSGGMDKTLRLWDAETGSEVRVICGHSGRVNSASFSPDGTKILSGSRDGSARVWDADTGTEILVMRENDAVIYSASFSPDGQRIVTSSGKIHVWDANTGSAVDVFGNDEGASHQHGASFSPDGQEIVSISGDSTIRFWGLNDAINRPCVRRHLSDARSLSFSPNGRLIVETCDQKLRILDAQRVTEIRAIDLQGIEVSSVAFSPDSRQIVGGSRYDGELRDANSEFGFYFASPAGNVRIWDADSGELLRILRGHITDVHSVTFSPDGRMIASGSGNVDSTERGVRIWNADTGEQICSFHSNAGNVRSVAFSPDGRQIVGGSDSYFTNRIYFWRIPDDDTKVEVYGDDAGLTGHTLNVEGVSFTADGRRLVSTDNETVRVWDIASLTCIEELSGLANVHDIARCFSHQSDSFLLARSDQTAAMSADTQTVLAWFPSRLCYTAASPTESLHAGIQDDLHVQILCLEGVAGDQCNPKSTSVNSHARYDGVSCDPAGQLFGLTSLSRRIGRWSLNVILKVLRAVLVVLIVLIAGVVAGTILNRLMD